MKHSSHHWSVWITAASLCRRNDRLLNSLLVSKLLLKWHRVAIWPATDRWYKKTCNLYDKNNPGNFWQNGALLFSLWEKKMDEKWKIHPSLHPSSLHILSAAFSCGYYLRKLKWHAAASRLRCETVWKTTLYFTMLLRSGCCAAIKFWFSKSSHVNLCLSICCCWSIYLLSEEQWCFFFFFYKLFKT